MRTRDIRKRVKGGIPHLAHGCTACETTQRDEQSIAGGLESCWDCLHRWVPALRGKTGNEEEEMRCPLGEEAAQRCRAFPWDRRWAGHGLMGQNQRRNQWGWHHRGRMPPRLIRVRANTKASLDSSGLRITDRPCSLGHFHLLSSAGRGTRQDTSIGEDF